MRTQIKYVVLFNGSTYYAAKQPRYEWSFTDDVEKACMYATRDSAQSRADWGMELLNGSIMSAKVVKVTVTTTVIINEEDTHAT